MTAHPYDPMLAGGDASLRPREEAGHDLRGVMLVTALVILMVVAAAVFAAVEWIAPGAARAVPG